MKRILILAAMAAMAVGPTTELAAGQVYPYGTSSDEVQNGGTRANGVTEYTAYASEPLSGALDASSGYSVAESTATSLEARFRTLCESIATALRSDKLSGLIIIFW